MGGLQKYSKAFYSFAPNVNSFKRLRGYWRKAPFNLNWGFENAPV